MKFKQKIFLANTILLTPLFGFLISCSSIAPNTQKPQYNPNLTDQVLKTEPSKLETNGEAQTDQKLFHKTKKNTALQLSPVAKKDFVKCSLEKVSKGNLMADNFHGKDFDPKNSRLFIASVNGKEQNVGKTLDLPSGAKLIVNKNGSFSYDPRLGFSFLKQKGSSSADRIYYTLVNGQGKHSNKALTLFSVVKTKDSSEIITKR